MGINPADLKSETKSEDLTEGDATAQSKNNLTLNEKSDLENNPNPQNAANTNVPPNGVSMNNFQNNFYQNRNNNFPMQSSNHFQQFNPMGQMNGGHHHPHHHQPHGIGHHNFNEKYQPLPPGEVTCFKCGEKGHYANKCNKGVFAFLRAPIEKNLSELK